MGDCQFTHTTSINIIINLSSGVVQNCTQEYGYSKVLEPLIRDLELLERGVFVQSLGSNLKGTVLYVSADNLGAHSLAGFQESFNVDTFCRFCMASRVDLQQYNVRSGVFTLP